jgi:hypothetical protein
MGDMIMTLHDACFEFLARLEQDQAMTVRNVREFLRDVNHYSKPPWEPCARSRALKYAAQDFLAADKEPVGQDRTIGLSWSSGWLRALAELHADEWFHIFEDTHPNMKPPFKKRRRSCIWADAELAVIRRSGAE